MTQLKSTILHELPSPSEIFLSEDHDECMYALPSRTSLDIWTDNVMDGSILNMN